MSEPRRIRDYLYSFVFGLDPDQEMEEQAKFAGKFTKYPKWYLILSSSWGAIIFTISTAVAFIASVKTHDKQIISGGGISGIMAFLLPMSGIILAPLAVFAIIQNKARFRRSLTPTQRDVYDASVKKRIGDYIQLFFVTLMVTIMFSLIIYLIIRHQ